MTARPAAPTAVAVWTALVTVYLVWGSTYLAIRVVVDTAPPLLAMGARFLAAGLLLAAFLLVRRGRSALRVTRRQLGGAALVGVLLLLCGNGGVAVAEQTVPSGIAALLVAATPLWLVVLRRLARDRIARLTLVGTLVGFVGIAVLVLPGGLTSPDGSPVRAWGLVVVVVAAACWALGSFLSSRIPMPGDAFVATTWEMLAGGVGLLLVRLRQRRAGRPGPRRGVRRGLGVARLPGARRLAGRLLGVRLAAGARADLAHRDLCVRQPGGGGRCSGPWCSASRSPPRWSRAARSWSSGSGWSSPRSAPRRRGTPPEPQPVGGGAEVVDLRT